MQLMCVRSFYRITRLHYTYGCATLSAAYLCKFYLENHCVTLHIWVSNLKCSLCLLALPTEPLGYTSLICVQPWVYPMCNRSTYRITWLRNTFGCATLSAAYLCKLDLQNHWVTLHLWVSSLKWSLFLSGLLTDSLDYTRLMGAPPKF